MAGDFWGVSPLYKFPYWSSPGFFPSRREAEVAAILAGMPSPDKKRADDAEARTKRYQERCDAKQAVIDDLCRKVAKLNGDLAQAEAKAKALDAEVARLRQADNSGAQWTVLYDCFPDGFDSKRFPTYTEAAAAEIKRLRAEVAKLREPYDTLYSQYADAVTKINAVKKAVGA